MAYSKVILNGTTLMDVTADTVAAATLLSGETATKKDGTKVTGTLTQKTETTLTATANDTYTPPSGSVYSSVTVNVPQTTVTSLSVTQNGTYTATSGTAYSPVTVDVPQITEIPGTFTQDGIYNAPTGSAYNPVTVSVGGGGGGHNIDITLGVSGTKGAAFYTIAYNPSTSAYEKKSWAIPRIQEPGWDTLATMTNTMFVIYTTAGVTIPSSRLNATLVDSISQSPLELRAFSVDDV